MDNTDPRLTGISRLYGPQALEQLGKAHVCIVGIGGVGSWAAEALARSGIGKMTLIDLDEICLTNINRQVHSLTSSHGRSKIEVMKERIQDINPNCQVDLILDFLTQENVSHMITKEYDFVLDAIDTLKNKCLILAKCQELEIPCATVGGAGGIRSPQDIKISDLNKSYNDKLLLRVRKKLRRDFGFPKNERKPWGMGAIYAPLEKILPESCEISPQGKLDCEGSLGSACFVTGSFGFFAASYIIEKIISKT